MALEEYRRKRDFTKTPEPAGRADRLPGAVGSPRGGAFVIQKHAARRLHYDFRLEMDGVLRSWAVTRGPSLDPADKRLAVQTEDHPMDYGGFEGIIPKGEYGGGTVLLWDRGHWEPEGDPAAGWRDGVLKFRLDGVKLHGRWALIRLKPKDAREKRDNWLLIKERDEFARPGSDICDEEPLSVESGRDIEAVAGQGDKVWHSSRAPDPSGLPGVRRGDLPEFVEPQLATLADAAPDGGEWVHEIKFDGYRAQCRIDTGQVRLMTRKGLDWTAKFGGVARAAQSIAARRVLLDGEVVVLDPSGASRFQELQAAISDGAVDRMVYYAFDLLHLDGFDLSGVALRERKELLRQLIPADHAVLRLSDHMAGRGPEVLAKACSFGLEGIVSKRADRPWRGGRTRDWIKAKCSQRQEFVIAGYTHPQGKRTGLGALLLAVQGEGGLTYAGKVGTGFSHKLLEELHARLSPMRRDKSALVNPPREKGAVWVAPDLVCEVAFAEWTEDGALRHPSFQGLRLDKPPVEVVREQAPVSTPAATDKVERILSTVRLTSPDKVLWPGQGITKRALAAYYAEVAPWMLRHVEGRPLSLVRCPQGHEKQCFFQRHVLPGMKAGIVRVPDTEGGEDYLGISGVEGLLTLVQFGVLEVHVWGSRVGSIDTPDLLVFDLDPDEGLPWQRVVDGAREVRQRLTDLGLRSWVKTTGGKGLHVAVPLAPKHGWDEMKAWTKALVDTMAHDDPGAYVGTITKAKRRGKIFIDYLRNQRSATFVAPFSTRNKPGAPVSVPLDWAELDAGLRSDHYTVETLMRRLSVQKDDPWADIYDVRQTVSAKAKRAVGLKE